MRFLIAPIFAATSLFAADPALLNLVMADANVVAGIDVDRAKLSPFGKKLMAEFDQKDGEMSKFIAATGFDPRRDLREIVIATNNMNAKKSPGLLILRGTFDASKLKAFVNVTGAGKIETLNGIDVITQNGADENSLALVDSSLAIAGTKDAVRAAVQRKATMAPAMKPDALARVRSISTGNDMWMVTTMPVSELSKAVPAGGAGAAGGFGGMMNGDVLKGIQQAALGMRFLSDVLELTAETVSANEKDATAIADVVRFVSTMVQMNRDNPEMKGIATALDAMKLTTDAKTTRLQISLPVADMEKMMNGKKPAVKI